MTNKNVIRYFVKSDGYDTLWEEIEQDYIILCYQTHGDNTKSLNTSRN